MDLEDPFDELRKGLRGQRGRDDDRDDRLGRRHLAVGGALALAIGLAVVLTSAIRPTPPARPGSPLLDDVETIKPSATAVPTTVATSARVWPSEPVEISGTEVRTGGHRWTVGDAGDLVAVGDWDCDGTATPAVVRPSASRLYVFDEWATSETTATATPGPMVPDGATSLSAEGCGRATVRTADGRTHLVAIGGAP